MPSSYSTEYFISVLFLINHSLFCAEIIVCFPTHAIFEDKYYYQHHVENIPDLTNKLFKNSLQNRQETISANHFTVNDLFCIDFVCSKGHTY